MNFFYISGIILLFLGLFWLMIPELYEHNAVESNNNKNQDAKVLMFALPGIFPTIIGIFLIEYYNKKLFRVSAH